MEKLLKISKKVDEMKHEATYLVDIAIILIFANIGGMLAKKIKQPAVLGQIVSGLVIGPALLNIITPYDFISNIAEIGVILLMFIAGMETDLVELKKSAGSSVAVAIGGIVVPLIGGFLAIKLIYPLGTNSQAIFTGVILTATSISITVQALREFGKLRERAGITTLGAAIMDDVLGIVILTIVVGIASPDKGESPLLVIGKILLFFIIALFVGKMFVVFMNKHSSRIFRNRNVASLALIACLILAFVAEEFGVATIIGAYFTGIIFSLTPYNNRVSHDIQNIAYTVFTPIFFVNIGLSVSFHGSANIILPAIVIILVAVLGKIIGSGLGARLTGFGTRQSLQIGIGMIPRAEVALIVANLGKNIGMINNTVFTCTILMVVVTTIITPPLLKLAVNTD